MLADDDPLALGMRLSDEWDVRKQEYEPSKGPVGGKYGPKTINRVLKHAAKQHLSAGGDVKGRARYTFHETRTAEGIRNEALKFGIPAVYINTAIERFGSQIEKDGTYVLRDHLRAREPIAVASWAFLLGVLLGVLVAGFIPFILLPGMAAVAARGGEMSHSELVWMGAILNLGASIFIVAAQAKVGYGTDGGWAGFFSFTSTYVVTNVLVSLYTW